MQVRLLYKYRKVEYFYAIFAVIIQPNFEVVEAGEDDHRKFLL